MSRHVLHFTSSINPGSTGLLQEQMLMALNQGATSLEIRICTDGGSTLLGFALYNLIKSMPVPVTTVNMGSIESMGVVMFLAGETRIAVPHSRFLLHPLNWSFNEGRVDHSRLTEHGLSLDNDLERYAAIFNEHTGGASAPVDIRTCLKHNAYIVAAEDAVNAGLVHEVRAAKLEADSVRWWIGPQ